MVVNILGSFCDEIWCRNLKWNTDELRSLDRKTRKFMTMEGALHPKSDINRI